MVITSLMFSAGTVSFVLAFLGQFEFYLTAPLQNLIEVIYIAKDFALGRGGLK